MLCRACWFLYTVCTETFLLGRQMGKSCSSSFRQTWDYFGEIICRALGTRAWFWPVPGVCQYLYLQEQKEEASGEPERIMEVVRFLSLRRAGGKIQVQTGKGLPHDYKTLLPSQDSQLLRAVPGRLIWPEFFSPLNVNTQQLQMIVLRLQQRLPTSSC